ncbi:hypothetical protein LVJ94_24015 [Pendulispora rubella]|uniref:Uncharacterized protein n=1 Tax=Pendulispora rubella TaxID=2741070 RepID=A0ABZ2LH63_9BACT
MTFAIVPAAGLETRSVKSDAPAAESTVVASAASHHVSAPSLLAPFAVVAWILVSELFISGLILLGLLLGALRLITIGCGPPI